MAIIKYFTNGCTILNSAIQAQVADGDKPYTVGWHSYYGQWWYANTATGGTGGVGTYFLNGWELIDGGWYYFDTNGYADFNYMQQTCGVDRATYGIGEYRFRRVFYQDTITNNYLATIRIDHNMSWEANKVKILKGTIDITADCYNFNNRQISINSSDEDILVYAGASLKIHLNDYFAFGNTQYNIQTKVGQSVSNIITYN